MSKSVTVCLTFDFDAMSLWIANYRTKSPNALSRGEFGRVGAERLLDLLAEHDIPATWFVPGHTIEASPATAERIAREDTRSDTTATATRIPPACRRTKRSKFLRRAAL